MDPLQFFEEEGLDEFFSNGGTWKMLLNINDEFLQEQYALACKLFEDKQFEEAEALFAYLAFLDPYASDYWMVLGSSKQPLLEDYTTAATFISDCPQTSYELSRCFSRSNHR